jgi:hypothetical protein
MTCLLAHALFHLIGIMIFALIPNPWSCTFWASYWFWACRVFGLHFVLFLSLYFPFCFWSFFAGVGASFLLIRSFSFGFEFIFSFSFFFARCLWLRGSSASFEGNLDQSVVWPFQLVFQLVWSFTWSFHWILQQLVSIWFSVFLLTFNWYLFSWYSIGSLKVHLSFWNSSNWYSRWVHFPCERFMSQLLTLLPWHCFAFVH